MGIVVTSDFTMNSALALDDRTRVVDIAARDAIAAGRRYEGLIVYVVSEGTNFQLVGGITNGDWSELSGGGGGGGAGANWQPVAGLGPIESYEFNEKVWLFSIGYNQRVELWVKAPTSYRPGNPITLKVCFYSPASSGTWALNVLANLVRRNTDAINSTANGVSVTTSDLTNTVTRQLREVDIVIAAAGTINAVAVNPGDLIRIVLIRNAPAGGTEDTQDLRFIPSSTEVLFA